MKFYYIFFVIFLLISPSFTQDQWGETREFVSIPMAANAAVIPAIPAPVGGYVWPYRGSNWQCQYTTVNGAQINYALIPTDPGIYFYFGEYTTNDLRNHPYLPNTPHVLYIGMSTVNINARVQDHYNTDFCMAGPPLPPGATRQQLYIRARKRACNVCWLKFQHNQHMFTRAYTPTLYEGLLLSFIASAGNHVTTGGCGPELNTPIAAGNMPGLAASNFFDKANAIIMNRDTFNTIIP